MADENKNLDLANFSSAAKKMIAANDAAYNSNYRTYSVYRARLREYTPEEIERILNSGSLIEKQKLSRTFFIKDRFYREIILYYATLLKYVGILIPSPSFGKDLSTPNVEKRYNQALSYIEKMKLPTLLTNISLKALIDGCYYGLIIKADKDAFTVLDLPASYCRTNFKDIYGNDIIEFDVSYFESIVDVEQRKQALSVYPKEIVNAWRAWSKGKSSKRWIFITGGIGICFPFFDGIPPFISLIPTTIQYDEAVDTNQEKELEEIKKIIVQQIPHLQDGRLLFEPDEAAEMHKASVDMMKKNKNVSVLTTYADVEAIQSKTTSDVNNTTLKQMLQNIYAQAGVSSEIFASTSSTTLPTSLKKDLALMMSLANKYSVFITFILNTLYQNSNISFKYNILPVSYFNEDEYIQTTFKLATYGYSYLLPAIALGLSQKDLGDLKDLENDVLKLGDKLKPLSSANTQSSSKVSSDSPTDEGGRPVVKIEEKAEQTIKNEESIENQTN